jgi:hypothetical protein
MQRCGTLKNARAIAAHESPRTTKLYDRTGNENTLDEVRTDQDLAGFLIGVKRPPHIRRTTTVRPRVPLRDRAVAGFAT